MLISIVYIPLIYAHCPLCTAAVGAAAISAKYYGLDASLIGLLIGAFGVSTGLWIGLRVKKFFKFQFSFIVLASFLITAMPLLYIKSDDIYFPLLLIGPTGSLLNKVYWIDKMLFGSIIGGLITLLAFWLHIQIKRINGKVIFPFQGVVITLIFLIMSGIGLYFTFGR